MKTFSGDLQKMLPQLQAALPRHIKPERFARIVLTAVRKNPKILECSTASVMGSIVTSAQLGLEPDGVLGEAWLVPYKGECQLIIGYQGFIKLAWQSGMVEDVYAEIVYEKDHFKWHLGTDRRIVHRPSPDPDCGEITHVYAAVKIKGGGTPFVVLTIGAVERIRERSRAKDGPWFTDYEAMVKKTAIRQLQKWIPKSKEQARAAALDELADANLSQGMGAVIDVTPDAVSEGTTPVAEAAKPPEGTRVSLKKDAAPPAQAAGAPTTVSAPGAAPAQQQAPAEPRATVASGTEGAQVAARLSREQAAGDAPQEEDRGDAPTAAEIEAAEREKAASKTPVQRGPRAVPPPDDDDLPPQMGGNGRPTGSVRR
jgi:recombination protein RecT